MRAVVVLGLAAMLAGCGSDKAAAAEKRYNIVKQSHRPKQEICASAREVAAAQLEKGDQLSYERWTTTADNDCANP